MEIQELVGQFEEMLFVAPVATVLRQAINQELTERNEAPLLIGELTDLRYLSFGCSAWREPSQMA